MHKQNVSGLQIDHKHCRAICDEIGDRLRVNFNREVAEIPRRLLMPLDRLAGSEREPSPSIVPSMADMGSCPTLHIGSSSYLPDGSYQA
jgi:hypothetical protein